MLYPEDPDSLASADPAPAGAMLPPWRVPGAGLSLMWIGMVIVLLTAAKPANVPITIFGKLLFLAGVRSGIRHAPDVEHSRWRTRLFLLAVASLLGSILRLTIDSAWSAAISLMLGVATVWLLPILAAGMAKSCWHHGLELSANSWRRACAWVVGVQAVPLTVLQVSCFGLLGRTEGTYHLNMGSTALLAVWSVFLLPMLPVAGAILLTGANARVRDSNRSRALPPRSRGVRHAAILSFLLSTLVVGHLVRTAERQHADAQLMADAQVEHERQVAAVEPAWGRAAQQFEQELARSLLASQSSWDTDEIEDSLRTEARTKLRLTLDSAYVSQINHANGSARLLEYDGALCETGLGSSGTHAESGFISADFDVELAMKYGLDKVFHLDRSLAKLQVIAECTREGSRVRILPFRGSMTARVVELLVEELEAAGVHATVEAPR